MMEQINFNNVFITYLQELPLSMSIESPCDKVSVEMFVMLIFLLSSICCSTPLTLTDSIRFLSALIFISESFESIFIIRLLSAINVDWNLFANSTALFTDEALEVTVSFIESILLLNCSSFCLFADILSLNY
nr:MAG TPA: hypothetical protein [Caudoviricetes sp.]